MPVLPNPRMGLMRIGVRPTTDIRYHRLRETRVNPLLYRIGLIVFLGGPASAAAQTSPRFSNPTTLPPARGYSHVVEVPAGERLVFISGQVPLDQAGQLVGAGDFRRQAEQVFTNLRLALTGVGATFADVVKLTIYTVDLSHLGDLREVRDRYVNVAAPPASSLVEVRGLFRPDVLLEVEAVAAVRDR
jgi:enamine deaminase RidA (YjgF/YER057c/UK114 family)